MLTIQGHPRSVCSGLTRRAALQVGGAGLLGLSLPKVMAAQEAAAPFMNGRAKSVMFLYLFGGPSQLESFDIVMFLNYLGTFGNETHVVSGDQVKSNQLRIIKKLGLLEEGETIQWFYTDGVFSIREGMYFLTEERLVMYSTEYEPHNYATKLEDIVKVELDKNESFFIDGYIEVAMVDGEAWSIPISSERGGDEKFFQYIKERHRPDRAPGSNQKLLQGLISWRESGGNLRELLGDEAGAVIKMQAEADAIVEALKKLSFTKPQEKPNYFSNCRTLVAFFETAETQVSWDEMGISGLPELRRLLREGLELPENRESDLFYLMEILAWYEFEEDVSRIAQIVRSGFAPEDHRWSSVFGRYDEDSGEWKRFIDSLRNPLPKGFVGIAFLDAANDLAFADVLKKHPFDSTEGVAKLQGWLSDTNAENYSYAYSSAVTLAYLSPENRDALVKIAEKHPDMEVQLECAWALAKVGEEIGIRRLVDWTLDVNRSATARQYLEELKLVARIPKAALEADFVAKSEMVEWLSHPNEFGRPPDKISQFDSRELYWP
ncbi:MAG: HEAT repeat domain-containing protein, partial [Limisphaerales bacterium]